MNSKTEFIFRNIFYLLAINLIFNILFHNFHHKLIFIELINL